MIVLDARLREAFVHARQRNENLRSHSCPGRRDIDAFVSQSEIAKKVFECDRCAQLKAFRDNFADEFPRVKNIVRPPIKRAVTPTIISAFDIVEVLYEGYAISTTIVPRMSRKTPVALNSFLRVSD